MLNKAYTDIVRKQSYRLGRDATWRPARNVLTDVDEQAVPLNPDFQLHNWDLRLNWHSTAATPVAAQSQDLKGD